jgi:hypothetical protein
MAAAALGLVFLLFFAAMIAALVFWIMKIVEVAQIPDPQYRAAGTDKTVWVLVVVLAGWIGAIIWQFAKRDDVLRARAAFGPVPPQLAPLGMAPPGFVPPGFAAPPGTTLGPPPGWYPEPGTGWFAYFDGYRWTGARRPPEGGGTGS